jgi:hypothetical protein
VCMGCNDDLDSRAEEPDAPSLMSMPWSRLIERAGGAGVLWKEGEEGGVRSLRTAKLWPVCPGYGPIPFLGDLVMWLAGDGPAPRAWRDADRASFSEVCRWGDAAQELEWGTRLRREVDALWVAEDVRGGGMQDVRAALERSVGGCGEMIRALERVAGY